MGDDLNRLEDKVNQQKSIESDELKELKKKFEEITMNAINTMCQLKEEVTEEKNNRRIENEKLEELVKIKIEELAMKVKEAGALWRLGY